MGLTGFGAGKLLIVQLEVGLEGVQVVAIDGMFIWLFSMTEGLCGGEELVVKVGTTYTFLLMLLLGLDGTEEISKDGMLRTLTGHNGVLEVAGGLRIGQPDKVTADIFSLSTLELICKKRIERIYLSLAIAAS